MGDNMSARDDRIKQLFKEAFKEWLDEKFLQFGKWSFRTISLLVFSAVVYFVLQMNGWHKF